MRARIGIAEIVDEVAGEALEAFGGKGKVVRVAHMIGMGDAYTPLGLADRDAESGPGEGRPRRRLEKSGLHFVHP